jgi:hypothetical protein
MEETNIGLDMDGGEAHPPGFPANSQQKDWMRYCGWNLRQGDRASDSQCPMDDPSILWDSGIWGAAEKRGVEEST